MPILGAYPLRPTYGGWRKLSIQGGKQLNPLYHSTPEIHQLDQLIQWASSQESYIAKYLSKLQELPTTTPEMVKKFEIWSEQLEHTNSQTFYPLKKPSGNINNPLDDSFTLNIVFSRNLTSSKNVLNNNLNSCLLL